MNPQSLFYTILLMLLMTRISAGQQDDGYGTLILHQVPAGSSVRINDSFAGQALLNNYTLPAGRHHITVSNPSSLDYRKLDYDTMVVIYAGQTLHLTCRFRQLIQLESQPFGADVFLKGVKTGQTPLWIDPETGPSLELKKKGFADTRVVITDSMKTGRNIIVTLTRTENTASVNQNLYKSGAWLKRNEKKYRTPLIAALTLSAISGAVAAYSKKKADDSFEKAKLAYYFGEFDKQKRLEKKTRRYDRYATIGYIGLQVNISASVVFLFLMN